MEFYLIFGSFLVVFVIAFGVAIKRGFSFSFEFSNPHSWDATRFDFQDTTSHLCQQQALGVRDFEGELL
jgi:hypothetical protein